MGDGDYVSSLDLLRDLAKRDCGGGEESIPAYLKRLGVNASDPGFPALVQAFRRFLRGDGNLRSHSSLRAAMLEHHRAEIPNVDILDFSVYGREQEVCSRMYAAAKAFYHIPENRTEAIVAQVTGNFFLYKKPANPLLRHLILRSFAKIGRPTPTADAIMILEMQKSVYRNPDIGQIVDHDFYSGFVTRKNSVLILMMSNDRNGELKHLFFDNVSPDDSKTRLLHRGYGRLVETCDGYTDKRFETSPCAILRIPDGMSNADIEARVNNVRPEEVDETIASYIMGGE